MTKFTKLLMVILVIVFSVTISHAGWGDKTTTIKFMSKDLDSFVDVLDGLENDKDVKIYGKLTIPKETKGKIPCVIYMHGASGGFTENAKRRIDPWLRMFNKMGIATFKLDSFKGRNVKSVVANQTAVTTKEMVVDVYKALEVMAAHPRIDKDNIGIMGGSKGGYVAFMAMWKPMYEAIGVEAKFAFHISLYASPYEFEDFRFMNAPLLILVGDADDWCPAEPWKEVAAKMTSHNYDVELVIYKGAHHSFDASYAPRTYSKGHSYTNCRWAVTKEGYAWETSTGLEEIEGMKKCRNESSGVTVGYNKAAKKASKIKAAEFVARVLNLKIPEKVVKKADNSSTSTDR
jgi:dienelactone hydrolase